MNIKKAIAVINQMQADGVVERYAIGGAVGATFYIEPAATLDVDVFVEIEAIPGSLLISLQSIYSYLTARGHEIKQEHIVIEGWPVQFLPPGNSLVEEALKEAVTVDVEGTPACVLTAEHLAAIALQTGRGKDKSRLLQFVEAKALNMPGFEAILARHGLAANWGKFKQQFLSDTP